jgi:two-component system LytT family response regulator
MGKLEAIIIDDEEASRNVLKSYLSTYCKNISLLGEASDIVEGEQLIKEHNPQVVFLDIEMPFGNGFDLLDKLESIDFEVVFITAYSNYAIKALNLSASYYLLKPIDIDELISAVFKVEETFQSRTRLFNTQVLADNLKAITNKDQKIVFPQMDGFDVVKISEIIRAEASDNYTVFYLVNGEKYILSKTLKYYEDMLVDLGFFRSHKSHLINIMHVVKYLKGKTGQVIMSDNSIALVSSVVKKEFIKTFNL